MVFTVIFLISALLATLVILVTWNAKLNTAEKRIDEMRSLIAAIDISPSSVQRPCGYGGHLNRLYSIANRIRELSEPRKRHEEFVTVISANGNKQKYYPGDTVQITDSELTKTLEAEIKSQREANEKLMARLRVFLDKEPFKIGELVKFKPEKVPVYYLGRSGKLASIKYAGYVPNHPACQNFPSECDESLLEHIVND